METKTFICTIDSSNWMRSLESSWISVTSPTGKKIFIHKSKTFMNKKINKDTLQKVSFHNGDISLTKQEMEDLLLMSKNR